MADVGKKNEEILNFWNDRANLGELAGTNDFMLTRIEQDFIESAVPPKTRVLDIGCGNSSSLIRLAKKSSCRGVGIDFSKEMIQTSKKFVKDAGVDSVVENYCDSVPPVPRHYGMFDVVISNRSLINLSSLEDQEKTVKSVADVLNPGGMYLMIECVQDGNDFTNSMREKLELEPICAPWHNLFFRKEDVFAWQSKEFSIEQFLHISSTYHFISRVVYAKLAELKGEELKYDSDLNKIAAMLPQQISEFGPVKAWVWKKIG